MNDYREPLAFFVHGNPVPKQSFRYSKHGSYQDPRVVAWEQAVGWEAKAAITEKDEWPKDTGGFEVHLDFYRPTRHRVDLDNLSKAVLDGLGGVVWDDDRLVYRLILTKSFVDREPLAGVKVKVYWVPEIDGGIDYDPSTG